MTATEPARDARQVDQAAFEQLLGKVISDVGAAVTVPLVRLGDRLGLFTALAAGGPVTATVLAARTGLVERYVREWLLAMAASGYVTYRGGDPAAGQPDSTFAARYELSPEQTTAG
jgi:hypothetical protein